MMSRSRHSSRAAPMRAMVLGGYGAVGARASAELRAQGHDAITAGRDATPSGRVVDVSDARAYREAVARRAIRAARPPSDRARP